MTDERLDRLAAMSASKNVVPAAVQFTDIGGLVEAPARRGLGNRFLGGIREVDAIVYVLRAFEDADVPGPTDRSNLRIVESDAHPRRPPRPSEVPDRAQAQTVEARQVPGRGQGPRRRVRSPRRRHPRLPQRGGKAADGDSQALPFPPSRTSPCSPWSASTRQLERVDGSSPPWKELGELALLFGACVQLEAEAALLDPRRRAEMLHAFPGSARAPCPAVRAAYHALSLRTFFTTGRRVLAWTFRQRAPRPLSAPA